MATYTYTCGTCGFAEDHRMSWDQASMKRYMPCGRGAKCNGKADRQTFYAPAAHFKGADWETNSHKKGKPS